MKRSLLAMALLAICTVAAFSSSQTTQQTESTQIHIRYNKDSASKQNRMPSYAQDEYVLCWYDGNMLYFDFSENEIDGLCTLTITTEAEDCCYLKSRSELERGVEIGKLDGFDVEISIPGIGTFAGTL